MQTLVTLGAVRQIALQALVNGALLPGVVSADVTQNSHYQPDTWRAQFALNAPGGQTLDWWGGDALVGALFDVQASIDGGQGWTSLIIGEADEIEIDPVWGLVAANGKDLTQRLVAARTQEAFMNHTSSEVATILAGRHGLSAQVTATTTLVDRFYAVDHDQITHDQFSRVRTEWDLLTELARDEGFDVFVSGTTLVFQPGVTLPGNPYTVRFDPASRSLGATRLTLKRSLTLAKDVQVVVRSWRSREGRAFQRGSPTGSTTGLPKDGVTRYVYTRPNLTEDQAQKLADQYREQITRHERTGTIECPVELAVSPRDVIQLEGVGTGWEAQPYYVAAVTRHIGQDGTDQTISIKNHSPQTDQVAA